MKKGLLLSVVASGFIFAGGNIAPVAPVQPQVAPAACDFWGTLAFRYDAIKDSTKANKWGKDDNLAAMTLVMGVEKSLGKLGDVEFGFGAEMGAFKFFHSLGTKASGETAEVSQAYITAKAGNTLIKAGRQALPKALSPWVWSDRTAGVLDNTFEGVVVVNTDIKDTTIVGAWVSKLVDGATRSNINGVNNKGAFALTVQNKSIADTTLTGSLYYVTEAKVTSAWASVVTKAGSADLGLQVAYAKKKGTKATTGVAAYAATNFNGLDAKLTLAYIKGGAAPLNPTSAGSAFWGASYYAFGGSGLEVGSKQTIARLDLGYKIEGYGKLYGGVAYDKVKDSDMDKMLAARVGYDFKVAGVNAKIEYRYIKKTPVSGDAIKNQRVRVQGVYKF